MKPLFLEIWQTLEQDMIAGTLSSKTNIVITDLNKSHYLYKKLFMIKRRKKFTISSLR